MGNLQNLEELLGKNFQPALPVNTVIIEVQMEVSDLFNDAAVIYSQEAERVMKFTTNDNFMINAAEFLSYFKTLLYLRVMRVNGVTDKITNDYRNDMRSYLIPAFASTLINSVGKATDLDFGFTFVPKMSIKADELMTAQEMRVLSGKLRTLNIEGLICIETGVAMQPEGDLNFMATLNIESDILSYRKEHPIFGFYAAFFKHKVLTDTLEPNALRVRYGAENDYRMYVRNII